MILKVIKSGFLSLVQDYGRYGHQGIGVTNGGPLDEHAFLWANRLLGNHYNDAQIEVTFGGFSAQFFEDTMIAICGADLSATLNKLPIKPWQSYAVRAGDTISFASPIAGLRCYLAIKGGFIVEKQLSSCSTVLREKLGGIAQNGSKLSVGDCINYQPSLMAISKRVPPQFMGKYLKEITLRFIPNTSSTSAGKKVISTFINHSYEVTPNIDRMGYRLSGKVIDTPLDGIISQGISLGAIQVPKDGQPIVLMKDRQTMGGYPLLGCVSYLDLPKLAQSHPGTKVCFTPIDVDNAEAELVIHKKFFGIDLKGSVANGTTEIPSRNA